MGQPFYRSMRRPREPSSERWTCRFCSTISRQRDRSFGSTGVLLALRLAWAWLDSEGRDVQATRTVARPTSRRVIERRAGPEPVVPQ